MYPFVAIPFFITGYFLHKHKEWFDRTFSNRAIWLILLLSTVIMCIEASIVWNSKIIYAGSYVVAVFLFMATFRVPEDRGRIPVLEYMGKYMTPWMYVYFGAITFLIRFWMQPYCDNYILCECIGPFIALALDVLMAYITAKVIERMAKKKASAPSVPTKKEPENECEPHAEE